MSRPSTDVGTNTGGATALDTLRNSPHYQPLWVAARRRLERNGIELTGTPLVLRDLNPAEMDAIAGLLGKPRPIHGSPLRVSPLALDRALQSSAVGMGLVEVLQALGGPLRDRIRERTATEATRTEAWATLRAHPMVLTDPRLNDWLDSVRRSGLARRLAGDQEADVVWTALDAVHEVNSKPEGQYLLPVLAARVTGDAHGLDRRRPAGTLTVHALSSLDNRPFPEDAADWRGVWAEVGVACDDLSCDVLAVGLPGWPAEPLRLTLRQVTSWSAPAARSGTSSVFVCENPAVVAMAADALDACCPALVCVNGVPSTAALMVLDKMAKAGSSVHYHGDFDWRGLAIAGIVMRKLPVTQPWRFEAPDYEQALASGSGGMPLSGRPQPSPWDPTLSEAMSRAGTAIYEEQVIDTLLDDLDLARP